MKPTTKNWIARAGALTGLGTVLATPSYAQITQLTNGLTWIQNTLTGIGVVVIVIAIIWCGFQMIFNQARWTQVAHIFVGGILIGGAAAIGAQLYGGGTGG